MGTVTRVNFGNRSVIPPAGPPHQGDGPGDMGPTYRAYFHAFFNPELNPFIVRLGHANTFSASMENYLKKAYETLERSKVLEPTINERAGFILNLPPNGLLGYLEKYIALKLDEVDAKAVHVLSRATNFVALAGKAIYDHRSVYGMNIEDIQSVPDVVPGFTLVRFGHPSFDPYRERWSAVRTELEKQFGDDRAVDLITEKMRQLCGLSHQDQSVFFCALYRNLVQDNLQIVAGAHLLELAVKDSGKDLSSVLADIVEGGTTPYFGVTRDETILVGRSR